MCDTITIDGVTLVAADVATAQDAAATEALVDLFAEIMETYIVKRAEWLRVFGNADGFDSWFTGVILAK